MLRKNCNSDMFILESLVCTVMCNVIRSMCHRIFKALPVSFHLLSFVIPNPINQFKLMVCITETIAYNPYCILYLLYASKLDGAILYSPKYPQTQFNCNSMLQFNFRFTTNKKEGKRRPHCTTNTNSTRQRLGMILT